MNKVISVISAHAAVLLLLVPLAANAAAPLSLSDTIDLSPGPDAYSVRQIAINHVTHKLYVGGAGILNFGEAGVKVIDTNTNAVETGIGLGKYTITGQNPVPVPAGVIDVDESANRIYAAGFAGYSNQTLRTVFRAIDGATDTRIDNGTDVFLPIFAPAALAVNKTNHKVYVIDSNGKLAVVDGSSQQILTSFDVGAGPASKRSVAVNPVANKVFVFGRYTGQLIDSASDSLGATIPIAYGQGAAFDPANNRIYLVGTEPGDQSQKWRLYMLDGTSGAIINSAPVNADVASAALTIDATNGIIYLEVQTFPSTGGFHDPWTVNTFSAADLTPIKSYPGFAYDLAYDSANGGRVYLAGGGAAENTIDNSVGILNPATGDTSYVTVGYVPNAVMTNPKTGRTYVLDEKTQELVILDNHAHSVTTRVHVNSELEFVSTGGAPDFGLSVAKNRLYLPYSKTDSSFNYTEYLDVRDASTGVLVATVQLYAGNHAFGAVAVDDTRHRAYVTGARYGDNGLEGILLAIDTDTNTVVATITLPGAPSVMYAAVNPVTGRVYVDGIYVPSGGKGVAIIDGNTNTNVKLVSGIDPGRIAINTKTNKVYIAHYAQGDSGVNTVQVIDGATDSYQTSFYNVNNGPGNTDSAYSFAIDEQDNRLFIADQSNGFQATGRVTVFSLVDNSYQGQVELGYYPTGIAYDPVTQQVFVANNNDGNISVLQNTGATSANLLGNISTRARVAGGDNVLIGGFIVTGPAGATKKVLVRAIGPSLAAAGVTGALPDTVLTLRDSQGNTYTNDNWKGDPGQPSQESLIAATGVAPSDDRESAIVASVPAGATTAVVTGKGPATGVALVEVYDLETGAATELANISTRGKVETGTNVMIGGVIVLGSTPQDVMLRAVGPSLTNAGVANALQDPILELRDPNGALIVSNDDWQTRDSDKSSQAAEIQKTTIPPTDPRESAVVATLYPNNYTAIVRGKGDTTGVALVEAYNLH